MDPSTHVQSAAVLICVKVSVVSSFCTPGSHLKLLICLGEELENYIARKGGLAAFDRLVYIGDGSNDFCPILRYRE